MKKNEKNSNLNSEQYYVLRDEGTEHPGSSPLNNEKRKERIFVWAVELSCLNLLLNMRADQVGLHFFS